MVEISYRDLVKISTNDADTTKLEQDLLLKIGQAFGDADFCLGILAVTHVPKLETLRNKLLPMARDLALLPDDELEKITDKTSGYQVGWSHGREKLEGDKLDLAKGSFYANPLTDDLLKSRPNVDPNVARAHPEFYAPNVWPSSSTALADFEQTFKELGLLVCHVGRILARLCDIYVKSKCDGYQKDKLEQVLTNSMYCKARLLHYFPTEKGSSSESMNWCGWHNDHGSLTGLVPAIYLEQDGTPVACPDEKAGLYIKSRTGKLVHVSLPLGSLGFQIGETSQIHTGGILQATPHAVRGCIDSDKISRESFAVFMEPEMDGDMDLPSGKTVHDVQRSTGHLPLTVKTLKSRWTPGMNFGEFSDATFAAFY